MEIGGRGLQLVGLTPLPATTAPFSVAVLNPWVAPNPEPCVTASLFWLPRDYALASSLDERNFAEHSYGFRPNRGCKDALRRVDALLRQGYTWVVDADLKSYFETIPHENLLALVERKVSDSRVLELIRQFLSQKVLKDGKTWTPEAGTPQGRVISPLLSNIYLDPLDQGMAERGKEMVRYADDFILLSRSGKGTRDESTFSRLSWCEL